MQLPKPTLELPRPDLGLRRLAFDLPRLELPNLGLRKDDGVVGLALDAGGAAAAEVRAKGQPGLSAAATASLPAGAFHDGEVIDADAVASTLRDLFSGHGLSRRVRLGIANQRVVVRTMRLPAIEDPEQLATAVRFAADEQIPMAIDEAVLDHRVVGGVGPTDGEGPKIDVVVVAARRDMIAACLEPLRKAKLEPIGIDLSAFGLIRALGDAPRPGATSGNISIEAQGGPPAAVLYCDFGDVTNLAIARGRACLFTRVAPGGLEDIAMALAGTTGLSVEHARMWLTHVGLAQPLENIEGDPGVIAETRDALESGAAALRDELRLSADFYGAQEGALAIERTVLTGAGTAIPGLVEWIGQTLGMPVEVGLPAALGGYDAASAGRLTVSYGLALEG
jgi:type IV pilus assembly protein PilM